MAKKPQERLIVRTVYLPAELDHRLKVIAFMNDMTKSEVMNLLIIAGLDALEAKGDPRFQSDSTPKEPEMNVNGTLNLFPLNLVNAGWAGYYVNGAGEILSTKRFSTPTKINGWTDTRGHMITLSGNVYSHQTVVNQARRHSDFSHHTNITGLAATSQALHPDRTHSPGLAAGINQKGVIIGTLKDDKISFSEKPVVHLTEASWKAEIERLATAVPGTQFIAVKVVASVVAGGLKWQ